ncbi:MAG: Gfo/Idh/MocA family oxidoreductase [Clostridia bacterium]|nr:Gfo/Idh/MocA family oxidoreductase [Clostridia bacterium]
MNTVRVGIIGTGGIANWRHIAELLKCENAEIVALCDINEKALKSSAEKAGVAPEKCYVDYRDLIADPDVDAVEVCTPNFNHAEIAKAVLAANKPLNLEKPIAMSYDEALSIVEAEKNSKAFGMTCFTYRFMAAARYAKHLVEEGVIGTIVGLNVAYLKNSAYWEGRPLEWRFEKEKAGSGVVGDLAVHLIDLAQLLSGNIVELCATKQIVVKERPTLDGKGIGKVTTDDSCSFIARFECGAEGCFHITRCAIGHQNTIRYDVYGDKGSISFDLNDPSILMICKGEGDPRNYKTETVKVPAEFYLMQEQAFVNAVLGEKDVIFPTLADGAQGQKVVDAILASAEKGAWMTV